MYSFHFYSGDSIEKQDKANIDRCNAYLDFQFNICSNPNEVFTSVAIASNASKITKFWGKQFSHLISEDFGLPLGGNNGILVGGMHGKNELDLIYTHMPAILILPLFISNPVHATWIKDKNFQIRIARSIAKSIYDAFPNGGLFAFTASSYSSEEYQIIKKTFGEEDPVKYSKAILRQTCIIMQSPVTSFNANYQPNFNLNG